jgi:[ribosomal protein S18]-alanine N-acetyltransferase
MTIGPANRRIRRMSASDLERVLGIQETLPEAPQWPASAYRSAIDPFGSLPRIAMVATGPEDDRTVGFLVAGLVPPEAGLETIAVSGAMQGQGIGRLLFLALAEELRRECISVVHLEVRASNDRARGFYGAMGFRESGRRPRYYVDPEEDAVLMALHLPAAIPA